MPISKPTVGQPGWNTAVDQVIDVANAVEAIPDALDALDTRVTTLEGGTEKQPLDADLTAISALDSATAGAIASDGAGWVKKTYTQLKTALGLTKGDVGLGNVDNTSDAAKPVSDAAQAELDALPFRADNVTTTGAAVGKVLAVADDSPLAFELVDAPTPGGDPLSKLAPLVPMAESRVEGPPLAAGATQVLADIAGEGTVRSIWIAHANPTDITAYYDFRLRIFVDGESAPSVDVDAATMFMCAYEAVEDGFVSDTEHSHSEMGPWPLANRQSIAFRFPIPYATGCRVEVVNTSRTASSGIFGQVRYQPGVTSDKRLKSICRPYANREWYTTTDEPVLFSTPVGSPGWLVWFAYAGGTPSATATFLERDLAIRVDGEATPAILSTGTEDVFRSGWYFGAKGSASGLNTNYMTLSYSSTGSIFSAAVVAIDELAHTGGLPFTSQMVATLTTESWVTIGHEAAWAALFYTTADSAWGTPSATLAPPSPPTGVRAYPLGNGQVSVTFIAPERQGSSPVTGYTITPSSGAPLAVGADKRGGILTALSGTLTFTVTATSDAGTSTASAASNSVTAPSGLTYTPTLTNLLLWCEADALAYTERNLSNGAPVWELPDLSGNRRSFYQPQQVSMPPLTTGIIGGKPVLRPSTTAPIDWMATPPTDITGALTIFMVFRTSATVAANKRLLGGPTSPFWSLTTDPSSRLVLAMGGPDAGKHALTANTNYVATAINGTSNGAVGAPNVWLNGTAGDNTAGGGTPSAPTRLYLNTDSGTGTAAASGFDVAAVIVYSGQMVTADRQAIERYLGAKYGITVA